MRASTKFETFTIAIVPLLLWKKEGTNRDFLTDQYWSLRKKIAFLAGKISLWILVIP